MSSLLGSYFTTDEIDAQTTRNQARLKLSEIQSILQIYQISYMPRKKRDAPPPPLAVR